MIDTGILRLGNQIIARGKAIKVRRIEPGFIENHYDETELEGIPLTLELLLKFGFRKESIGNWLFPKETIIFKSPLIFSEDLSKLWYFTNGFINQRKELPNTVKLHSLQNLYFVLTNKELEYERDTI